jgi:hypothetical protein
VRLHNFLIVLIIDDKKYSFRVSKYQLKATFIISHSKVDKKVNVFVATGADTEPKHSQKNQIPLYNLVCGREGLMRVTVRSTRRLFNLQMR